MNGWPELPYDAWRDTLTPLVNHWWIVPLYVTARGLSTSLMPYGERWLDMELDFVEHVLRIRVSDGAERRIELRPRSVANFHDEVFEVLGALKIDCPIWNTPVELVDDPIPLDRDEQHRSYDREFAHRFWVALARTHTVFSEFRREFLGKVSPVHFFWGSFDLAVTRFSGRPAPPREGVDPVTREAYSHEVSSVGFWPGDSRLPKASFYSYAAPEPAGFATARVAPAAAYYNSALSGFYLHYDDIRTAADPAAILLDFCRSTYDAAANLGQWDRASLERRS
jgi:hypothetical protein